MSVREGERGSAVAGISVKVGISSKHLAFGTGQLSSTSTQSAQGKDQLLTLLEKSEQRWLAVLNSVPEGACAAKLTDDSWTILQIAEHVAAAEHGMYRAIELAAEKTTPANHGVDQKIIAGGTNREVKRQAPAPSLPKGRWTTLAECAAMFQRSRARTMEMVSNTDNLRGKTVQHPLLGDLDGHQMVLVMATHAERHALQVEEIKASASYTAALGS